MGPAIKNLFLQQIRLKLQLVDGEVKRSKVRKIMNHFVRHISAAINRSASRNIFLKATKMVNLARHTQQNFSSSSSCDLTSSSSSSSSEDLHQQFELQIMNQDVLQTPNLSFLRFGKPLIHVCNNNIILVIKLASLHNIIVDK